MFENTEHKKQNSVYVKYALFFLAGVVACYALFGGVQVIPQESVQDPRSLASWSGCVNQTQQCWTWCSRGMSGYGWCYSTDKTSGIQDTDRMSCSAASDCSWNWKCASSCYPYSQQYL